VNNRLSSLRGIEPRPVSVRGEALRPLRLDVSSSGLRTAAEILRRLRHDRPDIAVEQVEHGVPRGLAGLVEGRLDALFGIATHCPATLRAELIRSEPVLVAMAADHPLAKLDRVPVARLSTVELLLPSEDAAPEWNEFVVWTTVWAVWVTRLTQRSLIVGEAGRVHNRTR
jgi:DNA-binding transcriptional LysR family regulator